MKKTKQTNNEKLHGELVIREKTGAIERRKYYLAKKWSKASLTVLMSEIEAEQLKARLDKIEK